MGMRSIEETCADANEQIETIEDARDEQIERTRIVPILLRS